MRPLQVLKYDILNLPKHHSQVQFVVRDYSLLNGVVLSHGLTPVVPQVDLFKQFSVCLSSGYLWGCPLHSTSSPSESFHVLDLHFLEVVFRFTPYNFTKREYLSIASTYLLPIIISVVSTEISQYPLYSWCLLMSNRSMNKFQTFDF